MLWALTELWQLIYWSQVKTALYLCFKYFLVKQSCFYWERVVHFEHVHLYFVNDRIVAENMTHWQHHTALSASLHDSSAVFSSCLKSSVTHMQWETEENERCFKMDKYNHTETWLKKFNGGKSYTLCENVLCVFSFLKTHCHGFLQ